MKGFLYFRYSDMYIKQLDGVRCFAVMELVCAHTLFYPFAKFFAVGKIGVDIFFTLSGFLITSILIKEKRQLQASGGNIRKVY
jgi:peptidoglycan/LPS O-acetylase OafA/YrhL